MKENEMKKIPDAAVQAELDTRLKAAGMYTVEEVMAGTPVDKWRVHSGMNNLQFFGEWLERKAREYKVMAAGYDLGDKDKSDELYEWVLAHSGAFHDVLVNFRAATLTDDGTKLVDIPTKEERHANKARNIIINQTSTDLENIINGHDPEQSILNNDVWDRLDKMACEIEALAKTVDVAEVRRQAIEEGFENGIEQSLNALNSYDDITRNEAEQGIRKLKPDYRALSAAPTSEAE